MNLNKKIAKDSITTTSVTLLVQSVSFVISAGIAALYGATGNTDAYFYALALVLIITSGVAGVLKSVFIPVFLRFKKENPSEEKEILGSFYFVFSAFLLGLWGIFVLLGLLFTTVLKVKLGGMDPTLLGKMLFQMSFLIILTSFVEVYSTVYNSYQKFVIPLITPLIRSVVFIGFVVVTRNFFGVQSLSLGNVVGEAFQLLLLFLVLRQAKISTGFNFKVHRAVKAMIKISLPPFLSNAMTRVNNLVDSSFIAPLLVGGVTILNYSSKIASIPEMILTGAFLTVVLSHWSLSRAEQGIERVIESLNKSLTILGFVFIPILSFMYFLRLPLVQLMYERKNFSYDLSVSTAQFLGIYLVGILPLILGRLLTRMFLVMEDTWTPFWVGNFRFVLNVVLDIVFIRFFGFIGVPLSTSITSFLMFIYMYLALRKKVVLINQSKLFLDYVKMLVSGVSGGVIVVLLYGGFVKYMGEDFGSKLTSLVFSCGLGILMYLVLNTLFKTSSVGYVRALLRSKKTD